MCRIHTYGLKSSHVRGVLEYITYILWSQPSIYVFGLVVSLTWYQKPTLQEVTSSNFTHPSFKVEYFAPSTRRSCVASTLIV